MRYIKTAQELYQILDHHKFDYEVVEIHEGIRVLRVEVDSMYFPEVCMRVDLEKEGLSVPASTAFENYDHLVEPVIYVTAEELRGAFVVPDPAHPDDHAFCYVELKDGRKLYFMGVDLDFK